MEDLGGWGKPLMGQQWSYLMWLKPASVENTLITPPVGLQNFERSLNNLPWNLRVQASHQGLKS